MLMSHHENAEQNHNLKTADRSFENVAQFKYLGATVPNQKLTHDKTAKRFNSGNVCYHSVQNLFYSRLLSKNVKIIIYKIIILLVALYGSQTCSLTLNYEHRLRVCESRVFKIIFRSKRDEIIGGWRKLFIKELRQI
jgi:hypothetical protein